MSWRDYAGDVLGKGPRDLPDGLEDMECEVCGHPAHRRYGCYVEIERGYLCPCRHETRTAAEQDDGS